MAVGTKTRQRDATRLCSHRQAPSDFSHKFGHTHYLECGSIDIFGCLLTTIQVHRTTRRANSAIRLMVEPITSAQSSQCKSLTRVIPSFAPYAPYAYSPLRVLPLSVPPSFRAASLVAAIAASLVAAARHTRFNSRRFFFSPCSACPYKGKVLDDSIYPRDREASLVGEYVGVSC